MIYAAIDIGTNSVRLLVAAYEAGRITPLVKDLATTRLGEGVHNSGCLGTLPMQRTAQAIAAMVQQARKLGAERITAVGTSAVRDAANSDDFIALCQQLAKIDVHVLDGEAEARLSYTGAISGLSADGLCIVSDIGGGSTELVAGCETQLLQAVSLNIGAVRLSELFPARADGVVDKLAEVAAYVSKELTKAVGFGKPALLIGVGGTITSLAAIAQALPVYQPEKVHGFMLTAADVNAMVAKLSAMTLAERREIPGLQPARADIIVYGAVIAASLFAKFQISRLRVSEQDILEGIIYDAVAKSG